MLCSWWPFTLDKFQKLIFVSVNFQQKAATRGSATASFGDLASLNKPKE